jgi:hypothetical protein
VFAKFGKTKWIRQLSERKRLTGIRILEGTNEETRAQCRQSCHLRRRRRLFSKLIEPFQGKAQMYTK